MLCVLYDKIYFVINIIKIYLYNGNVKKNIMISLQLWCNLEIYIDNDNNNLYSSKETHYKSWQEINKKS